jgi:hypothetical protein
LSDPNRNLLNEWRLADRAAHALERAISRASLAALSGQGDGPSLEDREKARRLRAIADDLFALAMAALQERARELRR